MTTASKTETQNGKLKSGKEKKMKNFNLLKQRIEKDFFQHPVIVNNPYTKWFKHGTANTEQIKDLILQFSVFSNHFIVVQCKRMVYASTIEGEEAARAILLNECGVGMNVKTGSIEGQKFTTPNAHLNWLRKMADMLNIPSNQIGRWETGTESTHKFLNGLDQTYGNLDGIIGAGASFAIETWAAFGIGETQEKESNNFWDELVVGLEAYNAKHRISKNLPPVPTGFFKYHFETEAGHGISVWKELEETFSEENFDEEKYIKAGKTALEAIYTFWCGLDEMRKRLN